MKRIVEIVKVSEVGAWPTHLWFYVLPFATRDLFGSPAFWVGCVYACFPLGLLLYGWNDIGDAESDQLNDRKDSWIFGARPDRDLLRVLPIWITVVQIPFVVVMVLLAGWKMVAWMAAVLVVNYTYNNLKFKSLPVVDLLNQVGYLLIFVMASWLCDVPQLNWPAMAFSALFAMQSHLFGQLMDLDADGKAGRRSTAILLTVTPAKLLLVGIMLAEVVIAAGYFRSPVVAWFMASGATFFFVDALLGPRRYPTWFTKLFFLLWNLIVLATMHWVWRYGLFQLQ